MKPDPDPMPDDLAEAILAGWARLAFGSTLCIHLGLNEWACYAIGPGGYAAETGGWYYGRGTGISIPWDDVEPEVREPLLAAFRAGKAWIDGEVGSTPPWRRGS